MQWLNDYQLFLFDFDGLLVNTEDLHYLAYQKMCAQRGFELPWDFDTFCNHAHIDSTLIKTGIYSILPSLYQQEPNWDILYDEKKQCYMDLLSQIEIELMPGATELLTTLETLNLRRAVVTNSTKAQIDLIKKQNPILNTIKHWITREDYTHPKPHPECYLKAIECLASQDDLVIGFEDSPKGLLALMKTPAIPILIREDIPSTLTQAWDEKKFLHFLSLLDLPPKTLRI